MLFQTRSKGQVLRDRIARIASAGWIPVPDLTAVVTELWDNVRNPFAHGIESFELLQRSADQDILNMELIVVEMMQAVTRAWSYGDPENPYDSICGTE